MSADFINGIGGRGPNVRETVASRSTAAATPATTEPTTGEAAVAPGAPAEAFSPTAEAGETNQDTKAGQARASEIFSAWGASSTPPAASAGQLQVQGAGNTTVNQVHSVHNGQHVGSQGPDAGFSGGTVYSSRPPSA